MCVPARTIESRRGLEDVAAEVLVLYDAGDLLLDVGAVDDEDALVLGSPLGVGTRRSMSAGTLSEIAPAPAFTMSGASKLISSSTFSMMVCRRRAPMFSVVSLTWKAKLAISSRASGANSSLRPSVSSSAIGLLDERGARLGEDAQEVVDRERLQLDADGKAALQFGDQVAGLGDVERARRDEEDVVGGDHAVLGVDGGAFDDGQDVALHAFAADVGAVAAFATGDLVDLVEEDDAGVFDALDGDARRPGPCRAGALFFLHEVVEGVGDLHGALAGALAEHAGQHVLDAALLHVLRRPSC